ncbi:MAG: Na/Pi cotransporter family protein [Deltaproteobacteria bacterium]|nr:Na/Pi cotransporter family protein [Deltaproteobacteria bacterium]
MKLLTKTCPLIIILTLLVIFFITPISLAVTIDSYDIPWGMLVIGMLGGLALFLYGMEKMSVGMKKTAGNKMRSILAALTKNRVMALIIGAFVTMVIQSSSATTVMLVSFVQAGLMSFTQSLGVILGADIGTTVTAQLIAFKLTDYALLMVAIGFGIQMTAKKDHLKNIGEIIFGFGILFYGMKLMSDTMSPLHDYPLFTEVMQKLKNPAMGLLAGTVFTALVQSSSASTGVVIVLAHQGLISLETGIPIIFGANIGTCVTAGLATINTAREAKRVALAHVLFKVAGVLLFIFWVPGFAELIKSISERFGSDVARQIANAHTLFNVSLAIAFLPFVSLFAIMIKRIIPDSPAPVTIAMKTRYLDEASIASPALGIELARRELSYMAEILGRMLRGIIIPFMSDKKWIMNEEGLSDEEKEALIKEIPIKDERHPNLTLYEALDMREEYIDFLNDRINEFLLKIMKQEASIEQANELYGLISIASDMESIGDLIHRNLLRLIEKKNALDRDFSEEGKEEILIYHAKVCRQIDRLAEAFAERNIEKAAKIMGRERKYLDLEEQYRIKHLERVRLEKMASVKTHEVHMELMDVLKQIVVYSSNIAKTFLMKCRPEKIK